MLGVYIIAVCLQNPAKSEVDTTDDKTNIYGKSLKLHSGSNSELICVRNI